MAMGLGHIAEEQRRNTLKMELRQKGQDAFKITFTPVYAKFHTKLLNCGAPVIYDSGIITKKALEILDGWEKREIEFLGELVEVRPGIWVLYFRGPDGEEGHYYI